MNDHLQELFSALKKSSKVSSVHILHTMKADAARIKIRGFANEATRTATSGQSDVVLISGVIPKSKIR